MLRPAEPKDRWRLIGRIDLKSGRSRIVQERPLPSRLLDYQIVTGHVTAT